MKNSSNLEKWYFSDNENDAQELANLVIGGKKTATTSIYYGIEPKKGVRTILTDFCEKELAVLELVNYKILPFNEVTEEVAEKEGEGNKTLEYWKEIHRIFFARILKVSIETFDETIMLLYEEFKVVKKF